MIERKLTVKNQLGLHLRPAGELCKMATDFRSEIKICFRNKEFSAGILNDFGQASLADKLTFCGKILIFFDTLYIALPALKLFNNRL